MKRINEISLLSLRYPRISKRGKVGEKEKKNLRRNVTKIPHTLEVTLETCLFVCLFPDDVCLLFGVFMRLFSRFFGWRRNVCCIWLLACLFFVCFVQRWIILVFACVFLIACYYFWIAFLCVCFFTVLLSFLTGTHGFSFSKSFVSGSLLMVSFFMFRDILLIYCLFVLQIFFPICYIWYNLSASYTFAWRYIHQGLQIRGFYVPSYVKGHS